MNVIERAFYERDTHVVARDLLGKILVREIDGKVLSGIIVETEAYAHADDLASHACRGKTKRNEPMFGTVGCAYVYFIYGNHFCFNIVAKDTYMPAGAVLIRAVEPVEGIAHMHVHRQKDMVYQLTNGPGKLAQALQITKEHNFADLTTPGGLYVMHGSPITADDVKQTARIGITSGLDKQWRFCLAGSRFLSR